MHRLKQFAPAFILMAVSIVLAFSIFAATAQANQSAFARVQSSAATSTYNKIAAGLGTTTITYTSSNGNLASDSAVLNLLLTASSSAPVLGVRIEHSYDGIDWYADVAVNTNASSTQATFVENRLTFATSTDAQFGSPGSGNAATTSYNVVMREIPVSTPTRFTRAVIYGVSGSGTLYGEIIAKHQLNN